MSLCIIYAQIFSHWSTGEVEYSEKIIKYFTMPSYSEYLLLCPLRSSRPLSMRKHIFLVLTTLTLNIELMEYLIITKQRLAGARRGLQGALGVWGRRRDKGIFGWGTIRLRGQSSTVQENVLQWQKCSKICALRYSSLPQPHGLLDTWDVASAMKNWIFILI